MNSPQLIIASGIFACCGKGHVFATGYGDLELFEDAMPKLIAMAEQQLGHCKQVMVSTMHEDHLLDLELLYHSVTNPEALNAEFSAQEHGKADQSTAAQAIVADALRKAQESQS